jgi:hypothetical protein
MAQYVQDDFEDGILTGQQWSVDNSRTLEEAEEQVADYLLPYLVKPATPNAAALDSAPTASQTVS